MIPRIDAHHHLWKFDAAQYGWIGADQHVLRRDFLPGDFEPELAAADISGSIAVQARQSLEELAGCWHWRMSIPSFGALSAGCQ